MKFPAYPTDILSRADALLSSKYPDGIVDPRFVEVACEAMMAQREVDAKMADDYFEWADNWGEHRNMVVAQKVSGEVAKAIRGTE